MNIETIPVLSKEQLQQLKLLDAAPSTVARLSQKHHLLCRYTAQGFDLNKAAFMSGYHPNTAKEILNSPASQELVNYYTSELDPYKMQLIVKLEAITHEAADELLERFSDPEERAKMSIAQLEKLIAMTTERVGPAPLKNEAPTQINMSIAVRMEAARKRMDEAKVIEHE